MFYGTDIEVATRKDDQQTSCTLFSEIQAALAEARAESETIAEALARVRFLMRSQFRHITVVRKFEIEDPIGFADWRVRVRYPDSREVELSHQS